MKTQFLAVLSLLVISQFSFAGALLPPQLENSLKQNGYTDLAAFHFWAEEAQEKEPGIYSGLKLPSTRVTERVADADFDPTGPRIATAAQFFWRVPKKLDFSAKIWNSLTGELIQTLQGEAQNPGLLAFLEGAEIDHDAPTGRISTVKFHPNGKILLTIDNYKTISLWDIDTGRVIRNLENPKADQLRVGDFAEFNRQGTLVMVTSRVKGVESPLRDFDKEISVWEVSSGDLLFSKRRFGFFQSIFFSPNGKQIVIKSLGDSGGSYVLNAQNGQIVFKIQPSETNIESEWMESRSLGIDSKGERLIWAGEKKLASLRKEAIVQIWDISTQTLLKEVKKIREQRENFPLARFDETNENRIRVLWGDGSFEVIHLESLKVEVSKNIWENPTRLLGDPAYIRGNPPRSFGDPALFYEELLDDPIPNPMRTLACSKRSVTPMNVKTMQYLDRHAHPHNIATAQLNTQETQILARSELGTEVYHLFDRDVMLYYQTKMSSEDGIFLIQAFQAKQENRSIDLKNQPDLLKVFERLPETLKKAMINSKTVAL